MFVNTQMKNSHVLTFQVVSRMSENLNPEAFKAAINKKVIQSLAQPGEAVGLICAQVCSLFFKEFCCYIGKLMS